MPILLSLFLIFNWKSILQLFGIRFESQSSQLKRQQEANRMSGFVRKGSVTGEIMQRSMYKNNSEFANFINRKIKKTK